MPEDNDKTLPKDFSDYGLPGRLQDSNSEFFETKLVQSKSTNKVFVVMAISFVIVASIFFSYYFINQNEIDSKIIQNAMQTDPEKSLKNQYNIGEYGSDHAHAAIAIFIDDVQLNFGLKQFQISSKYIHFENHNSYLIHRHATEVPLEMLFASLGMKFTQECIILNNQNSSTNNNERFCIGENKFLVFYVNGEEYLSDISKYVPEHNDRIMISLGDLNSISKHLKYLESLEIFEVPKKTPRYSENDMFV